MTILASSGPIGKYMHEYKHKMLSAFPLLPYWNVTNCSRKEAMEMRTSKRFVGLALQLSHAHALAHIRTTMIIYYLHE